MVKNNKGGGKIRIKKIRLQRGGKLDDYSQLEQHLDRQLKEKATDLLLSVAVPPSKLAAKALKPLKKSKLERRRAEILNQIDRELGLNEDLNSTSINTQEVQGVFKHPRSLEPLTRASLSPSKFHFAASDEFNADLGLRSFNPPYLFWQSQENFLGSNLVQKPYWGFKSLRRSQESLGQLRFDQSNFKNRNFGRRNGRPMQRYWSREEFGI